MIPITLSIKNFMCYREPPALSLESVQVACLCGRNGHGKSALLDAITWAVWGQARTRTQDELIHQGQTDMAVDLEFSARGQTYKISRRHSRKRGKQGASSLELQLFSDGVFVPITGNTIRETETAVKTLLNMDYDTFVNTAFLLQGKADLFSSATPAKRKETLAEVLGLSYYDSLAKKSRELGGQQDKLIASIDSTVAFQSEEVEKRGLYQADLSQAEDSLANAENSLSLALSEKTAVNSKIDKLKLTESLIETNRGRVNSAKTELQQLQKSLDDFQAELVEAERLQDNESDISSKYSEFQGALSEEKMMSQESSKHKALSDDVIKLEQSIDIETTRLKERIQSTEQQLNDLSVLSANLAKLNKDVVHIDQQKSDLQKLISTSEELGKSISVLETRSAVLDNENSALKQTMDDTRQKYDYLQSEDAVCPVCSEALGGTKIEKLRLEYEASGAQAKTIYLDNQNQMAQVRKDLSSSQNKLSRLHEQVTRLHNEISGKEESLRRDIANAENATAKSHQLNAELSSLRKQLSSDSFCGPDKSKLAKINHDLKCLKYQPEAHENLIKLIESLRPYEESMRQLTHAKASLNKINESIKQSTVLFERRSTEIKQANQEITDLEKALVELPALTQRSIKASTQVEGFEKQRAHLSEETGRLRERLDHCERLESQINKQMKTRKAAGKESRLLNDLAGAFGRNGIQAMIIETSIPQIQDEANEMLFRLTDGGLSIRLDLTEGRQDRSTGSPSEQLEIRVSDEMGTRSYETFSGGESFRINFAIRIALSKVLASRSGAPLPILFIDEGFGSQDEFGQDRLKEAINFIRNDFEKILVITHIEEIKDAFPTRIEVEKTSSGSTYKLIS